MEQLRLWAADLRHYGGQSVTAQLVEWNEHMWYVKTCHTEPWREALAWHLGADWLNVAEVVYPDRVQDAIWADGRSFKEQLDSNVVLVRIGQDYSDGEFTIRELDGAIASELVFSVWIRRRDAHPWNRAYVSGLPVFFDHHIAFGAEDANLPIATFFRPGDDGGYAGRWRVRELPASETPTTAGEREASGGTMAIHRVRNLARFDSLLVDAATRIRTFDRAELLASAESSRVPRPEILVEFLVRSQERLDHELAELKKVLWSEVSF